jgi:hypothetical protein
MLGLSVGSSAGSPLALGYVVSCLPWLTTILGKVPNLDAVVAQIPHWRELLWRPSCYLLLWRRRSAVELLLLMMELWVVSPELWMTTRLSCGWRVNHVVLWGSTARTTFRGSWHGPLPLLLLICFTGRHSALLINGSTG